MNAACRRHPSLALWHGACLLVAALASASAWAGRLEASVTLDGKGIGDAVVSLHSPAAVQATHPEPAVIDQRDTQFVPRISVIPVGSRVSFPNSDNVRHQVYSFSPAKRFQLPLYSGRAAAPVTFDTPGVVELGCNIHDWMVAYVVILDTPYHAISTPAGKAVVQAPAGRYLMRVWHPHQRGGRVFEREVEIGQGVTHADVALALSAPVAPAAPSDDKVRQLQERFRKLKRGK